MRALATGGGVHLRGVHVPRAQPQDPGGGPALHPQGAHTRHGGHPRPLHLHGARPFSLKH